MVGEGIPVPLLLLGFPSLEGVALQSLFRCELGGIHGRMLALIGFFHLAGGVVADDALAIEAHPAVGGRVHTRDDVERGGFAGAVRADQGYDLTLVNIQIQIIDGHHAAELHGGVLHFQHVFHLDATSFVGFSRFLKSLPNQLIMPSHENSWSPMMPLRKNSTTIIMTTENTSIRKPPRMKGMFTPI